MVKEVNIAVAIALVDEALTQSVELMNRLQDEHGIGFIGNSQQAAHITLCVGVISEDKLSLLFESLEDVLKDETFVISTNGLGLFLQEKPNLHIRWRHNDKLYELKHLIKERLKGVWQEDTFYNDDNNWLAKSSLAYEDFSYSHLSRMNFDKIKIKNVDMQVREISIIQFENGQQEQELYRLALEKENK
jgi:2'-5' RNA ligase